MKRACILITDFDGTMTRTDFYELVCAHCLPADVPDYWSLYSAGILTHFQAMSGIFRHICWTEAEVSAMLDRMQADSGIPAALLQLRDGGWDVAVVSNGSSWYIEKIFARLGVDLLVHSNPGRFVDGQGLIMELPEGSPYFSRSHGIDKRTVVRDALSKYSQVAFAGNGPPDLEAALMVPADRRFATGWLAGALDSRGESFRPFRKWSEIASALCGEKGIGQCAIH